MADLIKTVDPLDGDEADDDGAGLVLTKTKKSKSEGAFTFNDLVSDDEDGGGGWNFANEDDGLGATSGLKERISEHLLQKQEENGESIKIENDNGGKSSASKAKAKSGSDGTAEHLRTDIQFADLRLCRPLLRAITDLKFETPTPVQRDVIPPALQGLDVLATAETGSGKTASFLLPALERLCQSASVRSRKRDVSGRVIVGQVATKCMILIPTRELAVQCHAMLKNLSKYTMVTHQLVAGGFGSHDQASSLRQQPDIVVATPGRLLDHLLNSHSVHMELLEIVVFDEADRLLELGFREECMQVLKLCSKGRQTMLFSATMNTSVEDLAALALVKPVRVHANPVNRVAETLEQEFVKAPSEELREAVLLSLCMRSYTSRVIIFCATKQAAHRLAIIFGLSGLKFTEIHGNLPQGDRVRALQRFQEQEADFLIATDLAARGLDLCNVSTVVNFHLPLDLARYIHRVGRTARMGRVGRAVTIYAPEEYAKVKKLGRQVCTKVKSKVLKRTIAADAVKQWSEKVAGLEKDIESILQDESLEREIRLAGMMTDKAENLQKHKQSIRSRPAKEWYMSPGMKRKLKEEENEKVKAAAAADMAQAEEELKKGSKEAPVDKSELAEARRRQKLREKWERKKESEKAERDEHHKKIRKLARRIKTDGGAPKKKGGPAPAANMTKKKISGPKKKRRVRV